MTGDGSHRKMRVLLTGASGFVGRHAAEALLNDGFQLVILQNRTGVPEEIVKQCDDLIIGDVRDAAVRRRAVRDIDVVCHLAAYIPERLGDLGEAEACFKSNALATLGLAAEASQVGVERFLFMSTANMYAPSKQPCAEDAPVLPAARAMSYFASKAAGELYLTQVGRDSGMEVLILRVATPYGPAEPPGKVIPTFLRRAANGESLLIRGDGTATYNFVHVKDIAGCVAQAVRIGRSGTYNIASGEQTGLLSLARTVASLFDERSIEVVLQRDADNTAPHFSPVSIEKARLTWDYDPLSLAEGLSRYRAALKYGFAGR